MKFKMVKSNIADGQVYQHLEIIPAAKILQIKAGVRASLAGEPKPRPCAFRYCAIEVGICGPRRERTDPSFLPSTDASALPF